jgi:hypothetical protein
MEGQKSLNNPRRLGGSPYREEGGVKPPSPGENLNRRLSLTVEKNESFSLLCFLLLKTFYIFLNIQFK